MAESSGVSKREFSHHLLTCTECTFMLHTQAQYWTSADSVCVCTLKWKNSFFFGLVPKHSSVAREIVSFQEGIEPPQWCGTTNQPQHPPVSTPHPPKTQAIKLPKGRHWRTHKPQDNVLRDRQPTLDGIKLETFLFGLITVLCVLVALQIGGCTVHVWKGQLCNRIWNVYRSMLRSVTKWTVPLT